MLKNLAGPMELKSLTEDGQFSGYAAIFNNVDLGYDVVLPGAFKKKNMVLTKDGQIRVLYQHDMDKPIGKARVEEDEKGLYFEGQLILENSVARNAYVVMKAGVLDGMSFGYDVLPGGAEYTEGGVRRLSSCKLWEISPCTFGMNPKARVEDVKRAGQITTIREFEDLLRDACGYSNAQAKLLASGGWKALQSARDESGSGNVDVEQLIERVKAFEIPLTI